MSILAVQIAYDDQTVAQLAELLGRPQDSPGFNQER